MYSNQVWELVDLPEGVNQLDANGSIREREAHMKELKLINQG